MEKESPDDEASNALDKNKEPVSEVVALDHFGKKQANPTRDNATYKFFRLYQEKNFKLLIGVD
jgi:hypothetical protein